MLRLWRAALNPAGTVSEWPCFWCSWGRLKAYLQQTFVFSTFFNSKTQSDSKMFKYSKRRVPQQDCADVQADDDDCTPGAQGWCTPVEIPGTQPWNRFSKIEGILKSFEIKDFSILNVFFCFPRFDFKEFILMNPCLREIHCFQVAFDGVDPASVLILYDFIRSRCVASQFRSYNGAAFDDSFMPQI